MTYTLPPISQLTSKQPKNTWLIKGIIEKGTTGMFFGSPASGKSFTAMGVETVKKSLVEDFGVRRYRVAEYHLKGADDE
jgi:predicted ATPase